MTVAATGTTIFTQPSNGAGTSGGWLGDAWNSIQASSSSAGIIGALSNSKNPGTLNSFLSSSQMLSDSFATIAQSSSRAFNTLAQQENSDAVAQIQNDRMNAAIAANTPPSGPVGPTLDPLIFFGNGSTLDTQNNILTMADGRKIDSTTGVEIPSTNIMQLGNGSYIDLDKHMMTLSDGTKIDINTGQTVAVSV